MTSPPPKYRLSRSRGRRPTLRRALGPFNLTALGIGTVIGTGIFVLTGTAASQNAGPALILSMLIAASAARWRVSATPSSRR